MLGSHPALSLSVSRRDDLRLRARCTVNIEYIERVYMMPSHHVFDTHGHSKAIHIRPQETHTSYFPLLDPICGLAAVYRLADSTQSDLKWTIVIRYNTSRSLHIDMG